MNKPNTNDISYKASVVDQMIQAKLPIHTLQDLIHASSPKSIINLFSRDLRHKINALKHKSNKDKLGFASILASTILGQNQLKKLDHI